MATIDDITTISYSGILPIDALLNEGPDWNSLTPGRTTLYYTFNLAGAGDAGVSGLALFNANQKNAVYSALNHIASITGITFVEEANADNADFHFAAGNIVCSGVAGLCSYQESWTTLGDELTSFRIDASVYIDTTEFGDINASPTPGSEGYQVLLHELGHALGLKHPFEGPYTLPEATDNTDHTLMSYTGTGSFKSTYQQYDLLALAWLYGDDGLGGASGANGDSGPPPAPLTFSPADGAAGVAVDSHIVITFTEAIQRGMGSLVLKTASGVTVETFDASSSRLSISGSTLTIDPTSPLANGTQYLLTLAAGAIEDLTGNGSASTTGYDFTTAPANGQILAGTGGDDQFIGNGDNDSFDGGPGIDTLILSGLPSQYQLSGCGLTGIEGADIVANIEQYRFGAWLGNEARYVSDVEAGALADADGAGPGVSPATALLQGISDLYIAYFNRAPDVAGLLYWFREVNNGTWSLATIAQSFTDQPEYRDTYPPGLSNHAFIATIYQNLFDRSPDDVGWAYWEGDLNRGLPRDQFIYAVIQGAYAPTGGASDRVLLANKHTVSLYYSEQLALQATEEFDDNIEQVLNRVTAESQTLTQATAVIDFVFADPITLTGLISQTEAWEAFWV